jgi:hypothetical protein
VSVSPASAQTNLGTYSIGDVWAQLAGEGVWAAPDPAKLPPGVSLRTDVPPFFNPNAHAGLIGIATTPGDYVFTLTRDGVPAQYRMVISPLVVKTFWELPDAFVDRFYSYQFQAFDNGAEIAGIWSAVAATVPPGMAVNGAGLLSGTPTTAGVYDINLRLSNGVQTVGRNVRFRIFQVQISTPGGLPDATQNVPYSTTIEAVGGSGGYTFTVEDLPEGLDLAPDGALSGTITFSGHTWFRVTATDDLGRSYTKVMSLVVVGVPPTLPAIRLYDEFADDCALGMPCNTAIRVERGGRPPFTYTATGLPPGTSIYSGDGIVTSWIAPYNAEVRGAPTALGTYHVEVTVTDADGATATTTFDIDVRPMRLWLEPDDGFYGDPYNFTFYVLGGRLPQSVDEFKDFSFPRRLPRGLTLNKTARTLTGRPTEHGWFSPAFTFTDADGIQMRDRIWFYMGSHTGTLSFDDFRDEVTFTSGAFGSFQFEACCLPSLSWSLIEGTPPPGMTLSASGLLSGAVPGGTSATYTFTVRVEDPLNPANFADRVITVFATPLNTSVNLPTGNVGTSYSGSVTVTGAVGTAHVVLEPFYKAPPGLRVNDDGTITGVPTAMGQYRVNLRISDSAGNSRVRTININIYPAGVAPPLDLPLGPTLNVFTGQLGQSLTATGGTPPYTYSLTPGADVVAGMRVQNGQPLPTNFAPSVTGGYIGVLTTPGVFTTSIRVTDSTGDFFDRVITLNVGVLRTLNSTTPPKATVGVPYAFTMVPSGGTVYSWASSSLPPGLSIDADLGVITGTPTTAGTFTSSITLIDLGATSRSQNFTFVVDPFGIATEAVLPRGTVGTAYNVAFSAPGCAGGCIWSAVGSLPGGLTLSQAGVLQGVPSGTFNGSLTAQVAGANGTVQKLFGLQIMSATPQVLSITSTVSDITLAGFTSPSLTAAGGAPPYTWSVQAGTGALPTLPPGITLQGPGEILASNLTPGRSYLLGRGLALGTYDFTVVVTDSLGAIASRHLEWRVSPLNWGYTSLPLAGSTITYGVPYTQPLLVMGGDDPYTFAPVSMPPGLAVNATTGEITGTPANTGSFTHQILSTDEAGHSFRQNVNFSIASPTGTTLGLNTPASTTQQGNQFTFTITPSGGTGPYIVTALTPLPAGFTLVPTGGNTATLTGIAVEPGTFTFTLKAEDALGNIGVRDGRLTVQPFVAFATAPDGAVGVAYLHNLNAFGSAATWSATGLPAGLDISGAGVISGTPAEAGDFAPSVVATNGELSTTLTLALRVSNINIADAVLPSATIGAPYTHTFTSTGGGAAKVWSATGVGSGLTFSSNGTLSGTPSSAGPTSLQLVVTVTDGSIPVSRRFTLFILAPNPTTPEITYSTTFLADVTAGQSITRTLAANGGTPPFTWSVAAGSTLPPGLRLVSGAAVPSTFAPDSTILAGIVTVSDTYTFDLIATDSLGVQTKRTFTLSTTPIGVSSSLPAGVTGSNYNGRLAPVGGLPPYTLTMLPVDPEQDMLPQGISLTPEGLLTGITTNTGTYRFNLRIADSLERTFSRTVSITFSNPSGTSVSNTNPADTSIGTNRGVLAPLSVNSSTNAAYAWSLVSGSLPPGTFLSRCDPDDPDTTCIGGQPTATGVYAFTLRATSAIDGGDFADHPFAWRITSLQIVDPPRMLRRGLRLPSGQTGQSYELTLRVAGGTPPYRFEPLAVTRTPPGLTLAPNGVLSGTPTEAGSYTLGLTVTDAAGEILNASPTLVVTAPGVGPPLTEAVGLSSTLGLAGVGMPYAVSLDMLVRGGAAPLTFALVPGAPLPPGLVLHDGGNGVPASVAGIPTAVGEYPFTLVATDATGQTLTLELGIQVSTLGLSQPGVPNGMVGVPYSVALGPSGGVQPYTLHVHPYFDMPPGLSLNAAGVLSGTPLAAGHYIVDVQIEDAIGQFSGRSYGITIDNAAGEAPAISLSPIPVQVYREVGAPSPNVPIAVNLTSGSLPFTLHLAGAPWAQLSTSSGTAPSSIALVVDTASLAPGTYVGMLGVSAPGATNHNNGTPIVLTLATPPPCTYSLNPQAGTLQAIGGTGSFGVATGASCEWTAVSSDPSWLTVTTGTAGTGPGLVRFRATPSLLVSSRSASIIVNGQIFLVTQFGSACSFAINPAVLSATAAGGDANIKVSATVLAAGMSCSWAASGLSVTPASGSGNRTVHISVPANPTVASRVLTATIAGQTLTVNQSGMGCSFSLGSSSAAAPASGYDGSVAVTTDPGCHYDTITGPSWITVTSGGSNDGPGTLLYSVAPNTTTTPRDGALSIGGQLFTISQAGLTCSVTLDTSGLGTPFDATGGVGTIGVTTNAPGCSWAASSGSSWASVAPPSATGNGTVIVSVGSNAGSITRRTTSLTIGGQSVDISQGGTACTFALQSAGASVPGLGGTAVVGVVAPAACAWSATSDNPDWLTIFSVGSAGSADFAVASAGSADVQFVAQANPGAAQREGTLAVAGLTFTVHQAAAPCSYTLSSPGTSVSADGAVGSFTFLASRSGCTPVIQSLAGWIHPTGAFDPVPGLGSVAYTVESNPNATNRTGIIQVGGQLFTITQLGGSCGFSLNAYGAIFNHTGGIGSVAGSPSAIGCVPVFGTSQTSIITLGALTGPVLNIFTLPYVVQLFPPPLSPYIRRATITFGGQILTVKQTSW